MIDTDTSEERMTLRANALHALGFLYDTEVDLFFQEASGKDPSVISGDFVREVDNEAFFDEYYRIRKKLERYEKTDG